jgi:hypothetical protein
MRKKSKIFILLKVVFLFFIISLSFAEFINSEEIVGTLVGIEQETEAYAPIVKIFRNEILEATFNNSNLSLMKIRISIEEDISESPIIVRLNKSNGLNSGLPLGELYQGFEIEIPEINSSKIINATIEFKIDKNWFEENGITVHFNDGRYWLTENNIIGNIKLYKNADVGTNWMPLETNFYGADKEFYYFSAYATEFSTFIVFFNKYDCLPNSVRCFENKVQLCLGNSTWLVTETCAKECNNGKCEELFFESNEFFIVLITLILGMIFIIFILLFNKIRKK